jgi:DNA invertase Pin-like site-specific DNA recombinase
VPRAAIVENGSSKVWQKPKRKANTKTVNPLPEPRPGRLFSLLRKGVHVELSQKKLGIGLASVYRILKSHKEQNPIASRQGPDQNNSL